MQQCYQCMVEVKQAIAEVDLWDEFPTYEPQMGLNNRYDFMYWLCCLCCSLYCQKITLHVVGKEEVGKTREMHWLRIDRYYTSDMTKEKAHEEACWNKTNVFRYGKPIIKSEGYFPTNDVSTL